MHQEFEISENDLRYSERILLPKDKLFDDERIEFIKNTETIDLQAVPGSGKTTALLAKLLILEKKLPLSNGSAILAISHTNAAIEEIKMKIKKYCPKLFKYPNFIGTIQSFVDEFLTIPYYLTRYNKKPLRIDNEIYNEEVSKFSFLSFKGFTLQEQNNAKRLLRVNDLYAKMRLSYVENVPVLTNGYNGNLIKLSKPIGNTNPKNYSDWSTYDKSRIRDWLFTYKRYFLRKGILSYEDAYFLADTYLRNYPKIVEFMQKRFGFVFVDEMQDMDKHQHDLLESLFFNSGNSLSKFQRIGDINQAIFNGDAKLDEIWHKRDKTLTLNGSYRLNVNIANVVSKLALFPNQIEGRGLSCDNSVTRLKPHIIVFDNDTIKEVLETFSNLIATYQNLKLIPISSCNKYMAIGWRKENEDTDKLSIKSYWGEFCPVNHKSKIDFETLKEYVNNFQPEIKSLDSIKNNIINSFLKILRIEEILDGHRYYNQKNMLSYIENKSKEQYDFLKLNLYEWSLNTIKGDQENVYLSIKKYIPTLLTLFNSHIIKCFDFVQNEKAISSLQLPDSKISSNIYTHNGIDINVGTVHSAKGQTHTATLYLETFYERGLGNYESERLRNQFKGEHITETLMKIKNCHDIIKKSAKTVYVGFSRPTHLLCFAVHKTRFNSLLSDCTENDEWKVISISKKIETEIVSNIKPRESAESIYQRPKPLF